MAVEVRHTVYMNTTPIHSTPETIRSIIRSTDGTEPIYYEGYIIEHISNGCFAGYTIRMDGESWEQGYGIHDLRIDAVRAIEDIIDSLYAMGAATRPGQDII